MIAAYVALAGIWIIGGGLIIAVVGAMVSALLGGDPNWLPAVFAWFAAIVATLLHVGVGQSVGRHRAESTARVVA